MANLQYKVECEQKVITKILYHNAKYITCDIYGILIGQIQNNKIQIQDAFPLFHSRVMTPMLEVAFNQIESKLGKGQQILGLYQGLVNSQQDQVSELSLKISNVISNQNQNDSVIIKISNTEKDIKLDVFQFDKNYQNTKLIQNLQIDIEKILNGIQKGEHRFIIDFDNHFSDPNLDYCNSQIQSN